MSPLAWVFLLRHFFTPGAARFLTPHMTPLYHVNISSQTGLLICVCVRLLGGQCRGPGGCSEVYVWEQGSKALADLSGLLMTAIDRTSHTPSPCALHTTSSSTTVAPGSLTPASPCLTSPSTLDRSDAFRGPQTTFWLGCQPRLSQEFLLCLFL